MPTMTLEQYIELAQQEQQHPTNLLSRTLRIFRAICTCWSYTPLERLLLDDEDTFKPELNREHESMELFPGVGEIHSVVVPHPLSRVACQGKVKEEVEYELEQSAVVVFIHGLGGDLQQWDEQLQAVYGLSDIVALDLPGAGKSGWDESFTLSLENFARFVKRFLEEKGFGDRKLILVGHSYGTQVILKLLGMLPSERVTSIVLIAPPRALMKRTRTQNMVFRFLLGVPIVFSLFRKLDRLNNVESVSLKRVFGNAEEMSDYHKFKQFKFNLSSRSKTLMNQLLAWKPLSVQELIDAYTGLVTAHPESTPILIIDGDKDKVTKDGGATYRDLWGGKGVEYLKVVGGHNLMLESADELNRVLLDFIARSDWRLKQGHVEKVKSRLQLA